MTLTTNNKVIALTLAATLLGGTVGAVVEHSSAGKEAASANSSNSTTAVDQSPIPTSAQDNSIASGQSMQNPEATAVTTGNAQEQGKIVESQPARTRTVATAQSVKYSNSRTRYVASLAPRQQSGWEKHRNILTVALGTGGGALLGGLVGGRKGAAIGAAAGAGGGALYTYKLRKKDNRY